MKRLCPRAASFGSEPEQLPPFEEAKTTAPGGSAVMLALMGLATLLLPAAGWAQASDIQIQVWQKTIKHAPPSEPGCFEASYPDIQWQQVSCAQPQTRNRSSFPPLPPGTGQAIPSAGNHTGYVATARGNGISFAEGSFIDATGVNHIYSEDSKGKNPQDNLFSLQLNTNSFPVADNGICAGRSGACQGWVQFLYDNDVEQGDIHIRYWLLGVDACPASWQSSLPAGCYQNAPARASVPGLQADDLGNVALSGQTSRGLDAAIISVNGKAYAEVNQSVFKKLPQVWRQAEFNIFGHDAYYAILNFNAGSTLTVRTTLNNGTANAPACTVHGATGESGNLKASSPCCPYGGAEPSITFAEGAAAGHVASCAALGSNTISPTAGSHGKISPATALHMPNGAVSVFAVTPDPGYKIASITGCGGTISGNAFITAPAEGNCTVAAAFARESSYPTITTQADTGGMITPSGYFTVNSGSTATFKITPDSKHTILSVDGTCDGTLDGDTYTTSAITADCTVKVTFALQVHIITATADGSGIIYPSGYSAATSGAIATFAIVPNSRYAIDAIGGTCGGTLSGNIYTTQPITDSCTVIPTFVPAAVPHTVSPSGTSAAGIAINSWRPVTVPSGSTASFWFKAKRGYMPSAIFSTCGSGSMSGTWPNYTYTTGPVTTNCSVRFEAAKQAS